MEGVSFLDRSQQSTCGCVVLCWSVLVSVDVVAEESVTLLRVTVQQEGPLEVMDCSICECGGYERTRGVNWRNFDPTRVPQRINLAETNVFQIKFCFRSCQVQRSICRSKVGAVFPVDRTFVRIEGGARNPLCPFLRFEKMSSGENTCRVLAVSTARIESAPPPVSVPDMCRDSSAIETGSLLQVVLQRML